MKYKKIMALVVAVITITMAFAPAAMAQTDAPYNWSSWPLQKKVATIQCVQKQYSAIVIIA